MLRVLGPDQAGVKSIQNPKLPRDIQRLQLDRMCLLARRFAESGLRFIQVTHNDDKVQ